MLHSLGYSTRLVAYAMSTFKASVVYMDMKLMGIGVDPTTIFGQGPAIAMLGLALSAAESLLRTIKVHAECRQAGGQGELCSPSDIGVNGAFNGMVRQIFNQLFMV